MTGMSDPKPGREPDAAAALRYNPKRENAPRLIARGRGETARRIVELAREHGIPLYEDPALLRALESLEPDSRIPERLYEAVAGVLAFIYSMDSRATQNGHGDARCVK